MNRLERDHKAAIKRRLHRKAIRKVAKQSSGNLRTKHNGRCR